MNANRQERHQLLDIARGAGILLVVCGHRIQHLVPDFDDNLGFKAIYAFHMAFFFFISGVLLRERETRGESLLESGVRLWHATRRLLLPYLCWALIKFLLYERGVPIGAYLAAVVRNPDNGLWFLLTLWQGIFLAVAVQILSVSIGANPANHYRLVISIVSIVGIDVLPLHVFGLNQLKLYLPFILLAPAYPLLERILAWLVPMRLSGLLLLYGIGLGVWQRTSDMAIPHSLDQAITLGQWLVVKYAMACTGTILLLGLCHRIRSVRTTDILLWLGQMTLGIYAIHLAIGPALDRFNPITGSSWIWARVLFETLALLLLSAGLAVLLRQGRYTRLALLGE